MHAGDQGVAGHHQVLAGRHAEQGGVVADAQGHVGAVAHAGADAVDEGEFARHQLRRGACASALRQAAAAWSSTPLT